MALKWHLQGTDTGIDPWDIGIVPNWDWAKNAASGLSGSGFSCPHFRKEVRLLTRKHLLKNHMVTAYWLVISMLSARLITLQPVMADSIFDRIRSIVTDTLEEV